MNKKELAELKKNFSDSSDLLVLNHVVKAFVDAEKNIRCIQSYPAHEISVEETECLMPTFKRVLSGTMGKGLLEYAFPEEAYLEDGGQSILYNAVQGKLKDEESVSALLEHITNTMEYVSTYAILLGHFSYTVFRKSADDQLDPYQSHDYAFILGAICPVEVRIDGLVYNEADNAIEKKEAYDRIVAEIPSDGFLFPTFTGRGSDVNHVLYHTRTPKKVNVSFIENVLNCHFTQTANEQKTSFHTMMEEVVADELSYTVITDVNEKLRDIAAEYANEPELVAMDDIHVRDVLLDSGVTEQRAEQMQQVYRENTKDKPIAINNVIENKTIITAPDLHISIGKNATDKVRTQCVQGRRYLLIDLDDPELEINGMTVRLQENQEAPAET